MFAQRPTCVLVQILDLSGDFIARNDAQFFDHAERKTTRHTGQRFIFLHVGQRFKQGRNFAINKVLQTARYLLSHIFAGFFINKRSHARTHYIVAFDQLAHRMFAPHQAALLGKVQLGIGCVIEPVRPKVEFRRQRLQARCTQRFGLFRALRGILAKPEPFKTTNKLVLYSHFTLVIHVSHEALLLLQPAQKHRCAPINKSLGQCIV